MEERACRTSGPVGIALLAIACMLTACAGEGGGGGGGQPTPSCTPPDTVTVSFPRNIQPIFDRSCAVAGPCHNSAVATQALDLSPSRSRAQTVNVDSTEKRAKRIKPGDPDASYLVQKIEDAPGISGDPMPQGCPGAPIAGAQCLTGDDIAAIRQWILECATDRDT